MRTPAQYLLLLLLGAASVGPAGAHAETNAADKAAAEALFDRGLQLLRDGKVAEACQALEESEAVEPGIGTMLYLADCYERLGRTASAWALFRESASRAEAAGQNERAAAGKKRAEELEPKLARLTLEAESAPSDAALSLTRDGTSVPTQVLGVPLPVDPGEHVLVASAPGYATYSVTLRVAPEGAVRFSLPALVKLPPEPAKPATVAAASASQQPPVTENPVRKRRLERAAWGLGAGAVLGAVSGGVFGVRAIVKQHRADAQCPDANCGSSAAFEGAQRATDAARSAAHVANGLWIGGAVLGTAAVGLYFGAPRLSREQAPSPSVAWSVHPLRQGAALSLEGAF
jgi:hypothetical protein